MPTPSPDELATERSSFRSPTVSAIPHEHTWSARSLQEVVPRQVVISVGTDHHPFDRLVEWVERWSAANPDVSIVMQRGTSNTPSGVESHDLLPHAQLCDLFAQAQAVVSHGGPSTVMDARSAGRFPIVVARDPKRGEHVDGHQQRFGDHLERHGLARLVRTEEEFVRALAEALANPTAFTIEDEAVAAPPGVVGFGKKLDQLLDISTPLRSRA